MLKKKKHDITEKLNELLDSKDGKEIMENTARETLDKVSRNKRRAFLGRAAKLLKYNTVEVVNNKNVLLDKDKKPDVTSVNVPSYRDKGIIAMTILAMLYALPHDDIHIYNYNK